MIQLTPKQVAIMEGKICPYCGNETLYIDSKDIYNKSYGMIYSCKPCKAYCGVHKGTDRSLGRIANKELRELKIEAHKYFDAIWKRKQEKRSFMYARLSEYLGIPKEYTHIGMFSPKTCIRVIFWAKRLSNDLKDLDKEFGIYHDYEYFDL